MSWLKIRQPCPPNFEPCHILISESHWNSKGALPLREVVWKSLSCLPRRQGRQGAQLPARWVLKQKKHWWHSGLQVLSQYLLCLLITSPEQQQGNSQGSQLRRGWRDTISSFRPSCVSSPTSSRAADITEGKDPVGDQPTVWDNCLWTMAVSTQQHLLTLTLVDFSSASFPVWVSAPPNTWSDSSVHDVHSTHCFPLAYLHARDASASVRVLPPCLLLPKRPRSGHC